MSKLAQNYYDINIKPMHPYFDYDEYFRALCCKFPDWKENGIYSYYSRDFTVFRDLLKLLSAVHLTSDSSTGNFYNIFDVKIPAGGSTEITISYIVEANNYGFEDTLGFFDTVGNCIEYDKFKINVICASDTVKITDNNIKLRKRGGKATLDPSMLGNYFKFKV